MRARESLLTGPAVEPVTLAEVREQLNHPHTTEDALLTRLIRAARERGERESQRAWLTQTWAHRFERWMYPFELNKPPLQSAVTSPPTFVISYVDLDGVTQVVDESRYFVDAPQGDKPRKGRVYLAYNQVWPTVRPQANAITIQAVHGYGDDPDDVPAVLRQALLLDVTMLYETRTSVLVGAGFQNAAEVPRGARDIYHDFRSW